MGVADALHVEEDDEVGAGGGADPLGERLEGGDGVPARVARPDLRHGRGDARQVEHVPSDGALDGGGHRPGGEDADQEQRQGHDPGHEEGDLAREGEALPEAVQEGLGAAFGAAPAVQAQGTAVPPEDGEGGGQEGGVAEEAGGSRRPAAWKAAAVGEGDPARHGRGDHAHEKEEEARGQSGGRPDPVARDEGRAQDHLGPRQVEGDQAGAPIGQDAVAHQGVEELGLLQDLAVAAVKEEQAQADPDGEDPQFGNRLARGHAGRSPPGCVPVLPEMRRLLDNNYYCSWTGGLGILPAKVCPP